MAFNSIFGLLGVCKQNDEQLGQKQAHTFFPSIPSFGNAGSLVYLWQVGLALEVVVPVVALPLGWLVLGGMAILLVVLVFLGQSTCWSMVMQGNSGPPPNLVK